MPTRKARQGWRHRNRFQHGWYMSYRNLFGGGRILAHRKWEASANRMGKGRHHIFNLCFYEVLWRGSWPISRLLSTMGMAIRTQHGMRQGNACLGGEATSFSKSQPHLKQCRNTVTRQTIIPPWLFHWTGINSTLHISTFKWLSNKNWLSLRSCLTHKATPMHLPYAQIGKLKQKRGCETCQNESVAESELEGSCLIVKLQIP